MAYINDPRGLAHAKELIAANLKSKDTFLDLGYCCLKDLSELPELWDCRHLKGLKLGSHPFILNHEKRFTSYDRNQNGDEGAKAIAENLKNLTELDLCMNQIGDEGAKAIAENLKGIVSLNLGFNQIGVQGAKAISENLKNLTELDLENNRIGVKGAKAIAENLKNLTKLNFGGNQIGNEGVKAIAENLTNLTYLYLQNNHIYDGTFLYNLKKLISLDIRDNPFANYTFLKTLINIEDLILFPLKPKELSKESYLAIVLYFPQSVDEIKILKNQAVHRQLYEYAANLRDLEMKVLEEINFGEDEHSYILENAPKYYINIETIINPRREVIQEGNTSILEYYKQIESQGVRRLLEAKLVLLGDGRAGKTSLARRMLKKELPIEADRTKGVDISIGEYSFPVDEGEFKLHIWDFAGQDKYKPLHQFFYTESTVYVLVIDSGNAQTDFANWFETAELFGEGSPMIVALNEYCEGIGMGTFDEEKWRKQFPKLIKQVHLVNLLSQKGFKELERDIRHLAYQLPHTQHDYPENWANIRSELERRRDENFISLNDYLNICKKLKLPERNSALILSSVLHKIGVCLHYQKSALLRQHVILKNEWATTAVYKILEDQIITEEKKGFFNMSDLNRIWTDDDYQDMIPQLLALMCEFKMAYSLPNNNDYVTPPLLPLTPPSDWKFFEKNSLKVLVEYEFLPKALMTQFIVSRHTDIDRGRTLVWREGVVLRWPKDTFAQISKIKSRGRDAIQIQICGAEQRGLLTSIIKTFRDLHEEYKGIRVYEIVPCPCEGCRAGNNSQHYFEFNNLTHRVEKGRRTVECDMSLEEVDLLKLLGDLLIFERLGIGEKVELKEVVRESNDEKLINIFLASSSELAADRDSFDLYFRQLNDTLRVEKKRYLRIIRWENFLDAMSETRLQDEYNKEIQSCDIFVSLFFTKTGKFTEEEFDVAQEQFINSKDKKPQIFTFFKNADVKMSEITDEVNTLLKFKEKLKTLRHFHSNYNNDSDLKLQFRDLLYKLIDRGNI